MFEFPLTQNTLCKMNVKSSTPPLAVANRDQRCIPNETLFSIHVLNIHSRAVIVKNSTPSGGGNVHSGYMVPFSISLMFRQCHYLSSTWLP